jgi:integrase-like protein
VKLAGAVSPPLRRFLFCSGHVRLPTASGLPLSDRNSLRDAKRFVRSLGIVPPARTMHAPRHTFALSLIRGGGSAFHLMRILGHTTLAMSQKYVALCADDLKDAHRSPLQRLPAQPATFLRDGASYKAEGGSPSRVKGAYPGGECATAVLEQ